MKERYRVIYGETHEDVHIKDDTTNRRFRGYFGSIDELNMLDNIIEALLFFIKCDDKELIRMEDDTGVRWLVTDQETIDRFEGNVDIKTYEEYLESIKR